MSRNIEIARAIRSGIASVRAGSSILPPPSVRERFLAVASLMKILGNPSAEKTSDALRQLREPLPSNDKTPKAA